MKKIVAFVLFLLFAFNIAACSQNTSVGNMPSDGVVPSTTEVTVTERAPSTYNVSLYSVSLGGGVFSSDTPFVDMYSADSDTTPPAETKRSIQIGEKNYALTYSKTEYGKHTFSTADNILQCDYDIVSGKLVRIGTNDYSDAEPYIPSPSSFSEEQCIRWIKEFVSHYYDEDWDQYRYSCKTWITTTTENALWNDTYDGFCYASKENEAVTSYTFYFTRYIDGIRTSDRIMVSFHPKYDNNISVSFNKHQFDALRGVTFDEKIINQKISEFLNDYISNEYTLVKYDLGGPTIIVNNGKYYLHYPVDIELTAAHLGTETFVYPIILTVEI